MLRRSLRGSVQLLPQAFGALRPSQHGFDGLQALAITGRRAFSALILTQDPPKTVTVKCRSSGSITLNIHHPLTNPRTGHPPILIYLPPGPLLNNDDADASDVPPTLSTTTSATIVQLNYRLLPTHQYPTPIHDVLTGYDWILTHLAPSWVNRHGLTNREKALKLGVCGSLIGGGLATMLALTECRLGGSRVIAAAVNEPVVDWLFPSPPPNEGHNSTDDAEDEQLPTAPVKPTRKARAVPSFVEHATNPLLPASALLRARDRLFKTPDAYLDPFASPLLSFRTPEVAPTSPLTASSSFSSTEELEAAAAAPVPRKSPRLYPPTGSGLRLPSMRVCVGEESPLRDQGMEFVKCMRKAVVREGVRDGGGKKEYLEDLRGAATRDGVGEGKDEAADKAMAEAERRVLLEMAPGVGLWEGGSGDERWRRRVEEVGAWFRGVMR